MEPRATRSLCPPTLPASPRTRYNGHNRLAVTNPATGATLTPVNISVTLYVSANALLLVEPIAAFGLTAQAYSGQVSQPQSYTLTSSSPTTN